MVGCVSSGIYGMYGMPRVSCDVTSVSHLQVMYTRDPTHSITHSVHVQYTRIYICRSVQYHVTIYRTNVTLTHSTTHCICVLYIRMYIQNHISQYKCDLNTVHHTLHVYCTYAHTGPHITIQMRLEHTPPHTACVLYICTYRTTYHNTNAT